MDDKIFFIWMGIGIFTHGIRTGYEILKTNRVIKPGKVSFIVIFINMIALWVSWINMCETDVVKIPVTDTFRYIGLLLCISGVIVFFVAIMTIKAFETYEGDLMTKGIYSKIRHPMYLSFILWLIGYSVFCGALISFIVSTAFIANILFWRYLEENELTVRFPMYDEYKKITVF